MEDKEPLRILNSKEKKEINARLNSQWGTEFDKSQVFLLGGKGKLFLANPDIQNADFTKMRIDRIGVYVATIDEKHVRLSIEGAQILGPSAKNNVLELSDIEISDWFHGKDIEREGITKEGFVILTHNGDFVGSGKVTQKGILNFVPKARRILTSD